MGGRGSCFKFYRLSGNFWPRLQITVMFSFPCFLYTTHAYLFQGRLQTAIVKMYLADFIQITVMFSFPCFLYTTHAYLYQGRLQTAKVKMYLADLIQIRVMFCFPCFLYTTHAYLYQGRPTSIPELLPAMMIVMDAEKKALANSAVGIL